MPEAMARPRHPATERDGGGSEEARSEGMDGTHPTPAVPAIVVGGGITPLGATRCLARRGIRVLHAPGPRPGLLAHSRWFHPVEEGGTGDARSSGREIEAEHLERILRHSAPTESVLFPCSDDAVRTVASLPDDLRTRHRSIVVDSEALERLLGKARLADSLEAANVAHPVTVRLGSASDLEALPDPVFRRALVKPIDSQAFFAHFGVKAFAVTDRRDAEAALGRSLEAGHEVVLQEWVPGPPTNHYFVDGYRARDGETRGVLVRRRLRMEPPDFGNSSAMITVSEEEASEAVQALERLLASAGYRGIFSAEFKRDARDGVFRLLEVNLRPWWYVEFAARCGLDVCTMAYRDALGLPVSRVEHVDVGRRCVYPYYDLFAGWRELRAGTLSPVAWMRSWIGADFPVFAADDPRPAMAGLAGRVGGALRRRLA